MTKNDNHNQLENSLIFSTASRVESTIEGPINDGFTSEHLANTGSAAKVVHLTVALAGVNSSAPISAPLAAANIVSNLLEPAAFPDNALGELSVKMLGLIKPAADPSQVKIALAKADAAWKASQQTCDRLTADFHLWFETDDESIRREAKERLQSSYISLTATYLADIEKGFAQEPFRGAMIAQYVISANRYLLLLVLYYAYAAELELTAASALEHSSIEVHEQFTKDIAQVTDTATMSYRRALEKIRTMSATHSSSWDDYNEYRNMATVTGLDLLSTLVYCDPLLYPSRCDLKNLNRVLLTCFDTRNDPDSAAVYRSNISEMESRFNRKEPVLSLSRLRMWSGHFLSKESAHVVDGLFALSTSRIAMDGSGQTFNSAVSGENKPKTEAGEAIPQDFSADCFGVSGGYWNGTEPIVPPSSSAGPLPLPAARTISLLHFFFADANGRYFVIPQKLHSGKNLSPKAMNPFSQSIPAGVSIDFPLSPASFTQRLSNMKIVVGQDTNKPAYLFSWHDTNAVTDLLPSVNHGAGPSSNPVLQMHAVKASSSVIHQKLTIIDGAAFTGGNLVEMRAGTSLRFALERDPKRWFAGFYAVRLWFAIPQPDSQAPSVSINVIPEGDFSSSLLSASLPNMGPIPNLDNLQFADLRSFTFPGQVLITAAMPSVVIELRNMSLAATIVVDRIELIFNRIASDPVRRDS